ncbi:hypothetical protein SAMN04515620_16013 [Collimonas sp. OK607]|nr:hypothetical protein SAMN04515620_16013 [Collimonas sp. OK607]
MLGRAEYGRIMDSVVPSIYTTTMSNQLLEAAAGIEFPWPAQGVDCKLRAAAELPDTLHAIAESAP